MGRTKTKPFLKRKKVPKFYFHFGQQKKCVLPSSFNTYLVMWKYNCEPLWLKRHISIGVFVVYIDTGSSVPGVPLKSRDLADENNKILTEWKWFEITVLPLANRVVNIGQDAQWSVNKHRICKLSTTECVFLEIFDFDY